MSAIIAQQPNGSRRPRSRHVAIITVLTTLLTLLGIGLTRAAIPIASAAATYTCADPTEDTLRTALATGPNGAYFWSGTMDGVSVENRAGEIARNAFGSPDYPGNTLETALAGHGVTMPSLKPRTDPAVACWNLASILFADLASGTAYVVLGTLVRPGNIWETVEFPALRANPNIFYVISIDAVTGNVIDTIYSR